MASRWQAPQPDTLAGDTAHQGDEIYKPRRHKWLRAFDLSLGANVIDLLGELIGGWLLQTVLDHLGRAFDERLRVSQANMSRFVERPLAWEDKVTVSFAPDAGVLLMK